MTTKYRRAVFQIARVMVAAFVLVFFAALGFSQEARTKIRISYPNISVCCLALFAAQQWKIFEQNGLDVEIIQMRSQAANSALASGDIHYVAGVGPNSVAATLRGLPSKAVWFASESLIYSVMARPEFKSLKDLRGKRIGLTGLGGTSDVALRIALEAVGENPKDFIIVALGAPQLMSGLENGSIEAAELNSPLNYYAKKKGFRELLDIGTHVQMPLGGLTASNASIQNRTNELRRVIRSLQIAKRTLLQSKERAMDLIMRTIRVDREVADEMFAENRRSAAGNGVPTREGMEQIVKSLQLLGQFTGRKIAFEEITDARIAREVAKELGYKVD
ncbi:MAG TPA: ABC transporter substrate-binding protein [Candidatus Eisenbacteria bacterium]|nr:ABC transporter substrate-binding protein [Candidatus Eisenbacteria bacterium]